MINPPPVPIASYLERYCTDTFQEPYRDTFTGATWTRIRGGAVL